MTEGRSLVRRLRDGAIRSWQVNRPILVLAGGYILAVEIASRVYGFPHFLDLYHKPLVIIAGLGVLVVPLVWVGRERPERPFRFVAGELRARTDLVERAFVIGVPVILLALKMSSFSSMKSSISLMNPNLLDPTFISWDRALHGGRDPWTLLHAVLAHPAITAVIEWFYLYWLGVTMGVLAYAVFMASRLELRNQFIVAWILSWILLGTLGAIALNSVGPCFYGVFFPAEPDPFVPLMDYVRDAAPMTALTQDYLVHAYQELGPGFGTGISAMPSMHVAIAGLQAVFLWRLSRVAGIIGLGYAAIILVGSVHLGWHYAIDGYVAILLVPVMWWLAGGVVRAAKSGPKVSETILVER